MKYVPAEFISRIAGSPYLISILIIGIFGIFFFLILPHSKKIKPENYLPLMLLTLVFFYEIFAAYLNVNKAFNQKIHEILFEIPYQGWNVWSYNLFYSQLSKILFLLIILVQIKGIKSRRIIQVLWIFFILICIGFNFSGIEPLYGVQPIIYFVGNSFIIIACCLFFVDLVRDDFYLEKDPLKMWIFWFITLTLFQSSLIFLSELSFEYLAFRNKPLFYSVIFISQLLYISMMFSILVKFALEKYYFLRPNFLNNA